MFVSILCMHPCHYGYFPTVLQCYLATSHCYIYYICFATFIIFTLLHLLHSLCFIDLGIFTLIHLFVTFASFTLLRLFWYNNQSRCYHTNSLELPTELNSQVCPAKMSDSVCLILFQITNKRT